MKEFRRLAFGLILCAAVVASCFVSCTRDNFTGKWGFTNDIIDLDISVSFKGNEITISSDTGSGIYVSLGTYRVEGKTIYITVGSTSSDGENFVLVPVEYQTEIASRYSFESDGTLVIDEIGYPLKRRG